MKLPHARTNHSLADQAHGLCSLSDGFLTGVGTLDIGLPGAVAVQASYNPGQFKPGLFASLGIDCPDDLAGATDKRQAEYLAGRAMAQLGQAVLGHQPAQVARSENRVPIWPRGLTGSISHSSGRCVCLVLPDCTLLVGVDTEALAASNQLRAIDRIVATAQDRALIAQAADKTGLATLLFSAKETLFKLLYPVVGRHFGFACAEICAMPDNGMLHLRLTRDLHPSLPAGAVFPVSYRQDRSHVTCWAVTPGQSLGFRQAKALPARISAAVRR